MIGKILFLISAFAMILLGFSLFKIPQWYEDTFDIGISNNGVVGVLASALILVGLILVVSLIKAAINDMKES